MSESDYIEQKNGVIKKRRTHCKHGHPFDGTEVLHYNWKGYACRECRECGRQRMRRKRERPEVKIAGREATLRWRLNNPERYKQSYQEAFLKKKKVLDDARAGGCIKCGETHPACLDFHHRDPSEKEGNIGEFRKFGIQRVLAEIAKCDVLCANCHRKFHYDDRAQQKQERESQ